MGEARAPRNSLTSILRIEKRGQDTYEARLESFWGGSTAGDALARATLAVGGDRRDELSGIHATFPAPAPPDTALSLACEDIADDARRVRIREGGQLVCDVTLRFGASGEGLSYQSAIPAPGLTPPEELPSEAELAAAEGWSQYAVGPVESRRIGEHRFVEDDEPAEWLGWLRPREPLADATLHTPALVFAAEYRSHWGIELRLGDTFPQHELTLRDFALWIHRCEPWDDWWLARTVTDAGVAGRCLSRRELYTRRGALLASAAWETQVRRRR